MNQPIIKRVIGFAAAASTALALFSTVASLADRDKAALAAAHTTRSALAQNGAFKR